MDSGFRFFDSSCQQGNMMFMGNGDPFFRVVGVKSGRRSFFSTPEDLYDEEYYDEQLPEKKRRLTPHQVHMLEKSFEEENKLEQERKSELATKLGLQPRQVAVWFQNRRARWKTKQLERDFDHLKSSYDSLLSDYDSVLKDNEKLKAELVSLSEKLRAKEVAGAPKSDQPMPAGLPGDSSGSGGSGVVDEDGRQLVDSGDSYFLGEDYPGCAGPPGDGVQSEEDDGSDNGRNFFSDDFAAAATVVTFAEQQLNEGEALCCWFWS